MKLCVLVFAALLVAILSSPFVSGTEQEPLSCDVGPVTKSYGQTQWLIYSCSDNHTLVLVSAPGSPASPFVFTFFVKEGGYKLHGQGTGKSEATEAAFQELSVLSEQEIVELIEQTIAQRSQ